MDTHDPGRPSAADQNVERLLRHAYAPERPDPEFARRVTLHMLTASRQRTQPARRPWFERPRVAWALAAGLFAAITFGALSARHPGRLPPSDPVPAPVAKLNPTPKAEVPVEATHLTPRPKTTARKAADLAVGQSVRTEAGQRKRVALPDGSFLLLNEKTSATLTAERRVRLDAGEVYVEVAPREDDPFKVATPEREVAALGTRFAVQAEKLGTGVVVTQGRVKVSGLDDLLVTGQQLTPGAKEIETAPRATHLLSWMEDLVTEADGTVIPPNVKAGGVLTIKDSFGREAHLSLRKYHVDVHIEDGFARTTIDQTYFNHEQRRLEGTFHFPLPTDASLSRLAMYVNGELMEGGMAEREIARAIYEGIVRKMQDPALLEWVDGSTFKMRVFPLEPRQEKRIVLSYTQKLPGLYGHSSYRFPSGHSLEQVRDWSFHATVKHGAKLGWNCSSHDLKAATKDSDLLLDAAANNVKVDRDIVLDLRDETAGEADSKDSARFSSSELDGSRYLMLRYRPKLAGEAKKQRRDWVILFESSADRDPVLARTQVEIVRGLLTNAEHSDTFTILSAGATPNLLTEKPQEATPANVDAALVKLEQVHLVGALDLKQALLAAEPLLKAAKTPHLVHIGSGLPALGEKGNDALAKLIPAGTQYVGVGVGKRWNRALMKIAADRSGGYFTQINPDEKVTWRAFDLLATLNTPRLLDLKVTDKTGRVSFLTQQTSLAQGEELSAAGCTGTVADKLPEMLLVTGTLDGKAFRREVAVKDVAENAGYIPRTWAKLEIDRLLAADPNGNKARIVELSKAMYVMTPFTSLLVLENEQMYRDHKVDRGRKDHWAMYPCPQKIPVVTEPFDSGPAPKDPAAKATEEEVLGSVVVRVPTSMVWEKGNFRSTSGVDQGRQAVLDGLGVVDDLILNHNVDRIEEVTVPGRVDPKSTVGVPDDKPGERPVATTASPVQAGGGSVAPVNSGPSGAGSPGPVPGTPVGEPVVAPGPMLFAPVLQMPMGGPAPPGMGAGGSSWMPGAGGPLTGPGGFPGGPPGGFQNMGPGSGFGGGGFGFGDARFGNQWGIRPHGAQQAQGLGGINGTMTGTGYSYFSSLWGEGRGRTLPRFNGRIDELQKKSEWDRKAHLLRTAEDFRELGMEADKDGKNVKELKDAAERMPQRERYLKSLESGLFDLTAESELLLQQRVKGLSFSPDGKRKSSSGRDGYVRIWDVNPTELAVRGTVGDGLDAWLLGLGTGSGRPVGVYQRPAVRHDGRLWTDLLSHAPGLNSTTADVLATLEAEVGAVRAAPGKIDPEADRRLRRARAVWRSVTVDGVRITFDGAGWYSWERTLPLGLQEVVVCDRHTLWHLYPEIGLGARRDVSAFHRQELNALVPWVLPPADDLARGADLKAVGTDTVAVIPTGKDATHHLHLVFGADHRLSERRVVEAKTGKVVGRQTYAGGVVKTLDGSGKELASRDLELRDAPAPDVRPDTRDVVLVDFPLRSRQHILATNRANDQTAHTLKSEPLVNLLAADAAAGNQQGIASTLQLLANRSDNRPGLWALALAASPDANAVAVPERVKRSTIGRYITWLQRAQNREWSKLLDLGDGLLRNLAIHAAFTQDWSNGATAVSGTEALRLSQFVREARSPALTWGVLDLVLRNETRVVTLPGGLPGLKRRLVEEAISSLAKMPALVEAARYEEATLAFKAGEPSAKKYFTELFAKSAEAGRLPPIDATSRKALGDSDAEWAARTRQTMDRLLAKKDYAAATALAWQCWDLNDRELADEVMDAVQAQKPAGPAALPFALAALEYYRFTSRLDRADAILTELVSGPVLSQRPLAWRLAAKLASERKQSVRTAECLDRALELEHRHAAMLDVQQVRQDYTVLLGAYEEQARAWSALQQPTPKDFAARVVRAADRWRALDDDATVCHTAARILRTVGQPELAWEYLSTTLTGPSAEPAAVLNLARSLAGEGSRDLAELAYRAASDAGAGDVTPERAANLEQAGRFEDARRLRAAPSR